MSHSVYSQSPQYLFPELSLHKISNLFKYQRCFQPKRRAFDINKWQAPMDNSSKMVLSLVNQYITTDILPFLLCLYTTQDPCAEPWHQQKHTRAWRSIWNASLGVLITSCWERGGKKFVYIPILSVSLLKGEKWPPPLFSFSLLRRWKKDGKSLRVLGLLVVFQMVENLIHFLFDFLSSFSVLAGEKMMMTAKRERMPKEGKKPKHKKASDQKRTPEILLLIQSIFVLVLNYWTNESSYFPLPWEAGAVSCRLL